MGQSNSGLFTGVLIVAALAVLVAIMLVMAGVGNWR